MAKAAPPEAIRHLHERLAPLGDIECRRFFSGWGFRCAGVQFAVVLRERLYFVVDEALRRELAATGSAPASYVKKTGRVVVERFYSAPEDCLDDDDVLHDWSRRAIAAAGT